jgi:sugar-specific transcriptional regulator TrmB
MAKTRALPKLSFCDDAIIRTLAGGVEKNKESIAMEINLPITTVYTYLKNLITKGIVGRQSAAPQLYYLIFNPRNMHVIIRGNKRRAAELVQRHFGGSNETGGRPNKRYKCAICRKTISEESDYLRVNYAKHNRKPACLIHAIELNS